ncbi:MAG TPA: hypothetical protein VM120_02445 [Bryobacteraceae bacterium]|nr:hypothetical protein [Bryobacteraceae bacterium]
MAAASTASSGGGGSGGGGSGGGSAETPFTIDLPPGWTYTLASQPVTPPPPPPPAVSALRFVPVTPCRVFDTRNTGPFGGPRMGAGATRDVNPTQSSCNIPSSAAAYSLNATVVPAGPLSYLTLWPVGKPQPQVSTLNSFDGRIKANAAIVPAGTNGAVSVFVTDPTDVVLDINGYFVPSAAGGNLAFYPVTPCRIADTRNPTAPFGGPALGAAETRTFAIPQSACNLPPNIQAYSLNLTAVPAGPLFYLTTWPAGQARPLVSTLNAPPGTVVANFAIVPAGTNGGINIYATNPTDVIIDVNGYFAAPGGAGGLSFYAATPCRVADTRNAAGPFGGPSFSGAGSRGFAVPATNCSIPATAQAYSLNATVVPPGPLAYLTLWPAGQPQPPVSTLNAFDGSVVSNAAFVRADASGAINAYVSNATNLILDINGYFAP